MKENAVPAAAAGGYPGMTAAKHALLSAPPPPLAPPADLDDAMSGAADPGSLPSRSSARAGTAVAGAGGRAAAEVGFPARRRLADRPTSNSTMASGAGASFDCGMLGGGCGGAGSAPADLGEMGTLIPLHRVASAPMLQAPLPLPATTVDGHAVWRSSAPATAPLPVSAVLSSRGSGAPAPAPAAGASAAGAAPSRRALTSLSIPGSGGSSALGSGGGGGGGHCFALPPPPLPASMSAPASSLESEGGSGGGGFRVPSLPTPAAAAAHSDGDVVMRGGGGGGAPAAAAAAAGGSSPGGGGDPLNDTVQALHAYLSAPTASRFVAPRLLDQSASCRPRVWVTVWLDYTTKYGLGYLLSNGNVGVCFNGSTRVVLCAPGTGLFAAQCRSAPASRALGALGATPDAAAAGSVLEYVDRVGHGKVQVTGPGSLAAEGFPYNVSGDGTARLVASLKLFPGGLEKKVKLLNYFRKVLGDQYAKRKDLTRSCGIRAAESSVPFAAVAAAAAHAAATAAGCVLVEGGLPVANPDSDLFVATGVAANGGVTVCVGSEEEASMSMGTGAEQLVFVKKYIRTRRAILFRLSNRTFQASFYDGVVLLLHTEGHLFTLTDAAGGRVTWDTSATLTAADDAEAAGSTGAHVDRLLAAARRLRYVRDAIGQLATTAAVPPPAAAGAGSDAAAPTTPA